MIDWNKMTVGAPLRAAPSVQEEVILSLHYEGANLSTVWETFSTWTPPKWVTQSSLLFDLGSQSCSLRLQIEGPCLSRCSTEKSVPALTARTLRSLLTLSSQSGLSVTAVSTLASPDVDNALLSVLSEF